MDFGGVVTILVVSLLGGFASFWLIRNGIALWRASTPKRKRRARKAGPERVRVEAPRCPYCHDDVSPSDPEKQACSICMTWHHQDCWAEHGGCSSCAVGGRTSTSIKE